MRIYLTLEYLWRFLKAKPARMNQALFDAQDDNMVFQIPSWEKNLLEKNRPVDERAE
jgi:hypothetical protein